MSKKNKISITHTEDFSEIETELSNAMEGLDEANLRIEAMLKEHAQTDAVTPSETSPEQPDNAEDGATQEKSSG